MFVARPSFHFISFHLIFLNDYDWPLPIFFYWRWPRAPPRLQVRMWRVRLLRREDTADAEADPTERRRSRSSYPSGPSGMGIGDGGMTKQNGLIWCGGFHEWYPNSWMVDNGKSPCNLFDLNQTWDMVICLKFSASKMSSPWNMVKHGHAEELGLKPLGRQ